MASTLSESNARKFSTMPWNYRIREMIGDHDMPLTNVLITIVAAGVLLWLVNRFIPMQGQIKSILNGLVVVVLVLWIANLYGLFQHLNQFRVGK
jgi:chromate transport protein ChrA